MGDTDNSLDNSDTETDNNQVKIYFLRLMGSLLHNLQVTVKPCDSLDDPERQEDFDIFGLPPNYYAKYEEEEEDADSGEFYFDTDLNLDAEVEDQLVAAELLRPERLDTVEEVSEPASGISSQLTSLTYSQDMDQASLPAQDLVPASLQSSFSSKEEMFSTTELEFRNSFRSQRSYDSSLTYVRNPFEIFGKTEG